MALFSSFPGQVKRVLILALFFLLPAVVLPFQTTNNGTPVPAVKYIFYWGSLQCDLTEANGFRGSLSCAAPAFRQMLLSAPRLWNGTTLVKDISFKIDGRQITSADYLAQIGQLDTLFGQKVVAGQVFRLTGLLLDGKTIASIELAITEPEKKKEPNHRSFWQSPPASYLNEAFLERVIWGREDIYELANRDFFTVTEFWQTVRQLPYVEWKRYATPAPLAASILFSDLGSTTFGLSAKLEEEEYRHLLENLENYRHLVKAGTTLSLALKTAERHDELFQKRMILVPDNDPRLALRRDRDAHTLTLRWGHWSEKIQHLYLLRLPDGKTQSMPVDPPLARGFGCPLAEAITLLGLHPELRIDDQALSDLTFRMSTDSTSVVVSPGEIMPASLLREIKTNGLGRGLIQLDSFRAPGFDLPATTLYLNYFDPANQIPTANDFKSLVVAPGSIRIKLAPPGTAETELFFDFEIPDSVRVKFSVFGPEGSDVFALENLFPSGRHTIRVPRNAFREKGKHYCFLNTPLGVAKQEFVVPGL